MIFFIAFIITIIPRPINANSNICNMPHKPIEYVRQDRWALKPEEIIDYDALPDVIYNIMFGDMGVSPGCPGATTEDECFYILGCSWCTWNNLGCTYKDIADALPIDSTVNELCSSADSISGEPNEKQLFYFNYGRYPPITVSR